MAGDFHGGPKIPEMKNWFLSPKGVQNLVPSITRILWGRVPAQLVREKRTLRKLTGGGDT